VARWLAVFASLNQVALLKRALYREGIYAEMVRTPHCYSSTGCSFALRCQLSEIPLLKQICHQWKIEPGGFFEEPETSEVTPDQSFIDEDG
jgi:hypothetical protein